MLAAKTEQICQWSAQYYETETLTATDFFTPLLTEVSTEISVVQCGSINQRLCLACT